MPVKGEEVFALMVSAFFYTCNSVFIKIGVVRQPLEGDFNGKLQLWDGLSEPNPLKMKLSDQRSELLKQVRPKRT
jgi:hypothetical protein